MKRVWLTLAITILLAVCSALVRAAQQSSVRQVVILIGGVSVTDLVERDLPFLKGTALPSGAIALLNNRTAATYSPENCYASLASGSRAQAPADTRLFQAIDELSLVGPGDDVFRRYYSETLPTSQDNSFTPGYLVSRRFLARTQAQSKYVIHHGLIAETLATQGLSPVIIGAGDSAEAVYRPSALLAMQPTGVVAATDFTGVLTTDPGYPGGRRTNYPAAIRQIQAALPLHPIIFVETGDFLRLYQETEVMEPQILQRWKTRLLGELDQFLGALSQQITQPVQYWLISAYPAKDAYRSGNPITFLITWGIPGRSGLLTSSTTRRAGFVTNTDFAPSLLATLGLPAPATYGTPIRSVPALPEDALGSLVDLNERWVKVNALRSPLLKSYVISQIGVVAAGALALFFAYRTARPHPALTKLIRALCIAETSVPLMLLVLSYFPPANLIFTLAFVVPLAIGIFAVRTGILIPTFALVYLGTAVAVVGDTVLGWGLGANSLLGYDPIGGARFYGIGNEYMGVLVGSFFLGWSLVSLSSKPYWAEIGPTASGVISLVVLGSPWWGANVGGTIGFTAALAAWMFLGRRDGLHLSQLIYTIIAILAILGVFVIWDLWYNPETSHLGRFALSVAANGLGTVWEVFHRKLAMNWKLLHYTIWADGLLTFIAGVALAFWKPRGLIKKLFEQNPRIVRGFWTALVGTAAVFAANDSGVVAAATLMIYPSFLLLALALELTP